MELLHVHCTIKQSRNDYWYLTIWYRCRSSFPFVLILSIALFHVDIVPPCCLFSVLLFASFMLWFGAIYYRSLRLFAFSGNSNIRVRAIEKRKRARIRAKETINKKSDNISPSLLIQ